MAFELIDTNAGNVFGVYETQDAALRDVAETARLYGAAYIATLALTTDASGGRQGRLIAGGAHLAEMADQVILADTTAPAVVPVGQFVFRTGGIVEVGELKAPIGERYFLGIPAEMTGSVSFSAEGQWSLRDPETMNVAQLQRVSVKTMPRTRVRLRTRTRTGRRGKGK